MANQHSDNDRAGDLPGETGLPSRWRFPGIKFWLRVGVSAGLICFLAWNMDPREVSIAIRDLRWKFWSAALFCFLLSQVISAVRWSSLARPIGFHAKTARFLKLYFEGMFFSLCLPSSIGGDVIKAWRLGTTASERVLAGCTVITDRLTGLCGVTLIGCGALAFRANAESTAVGVISTIAVVAGGLIVIRIGLLFWRTYASHIEAIPKAGGTFTSLRPYHDRPSVLMIGVGYSLAVQFLNGMTVFLLGLALNFDIPPVAYFICVPLAALASVLPSVGGIGVREGTLAYLLVEFGLPQADGKILGFLWLFVIILGSLVGGIVYLFDRKSSQQPKTVESPDSTENKNETAFAISEVTAP